MSNHIARFLELGKDAPKHAEQVRMLARHFEDLAEQIEHAGTSREGLYIEPHCHLVENTLRKIKPWHHEVVAYAQQISEGERLAILKALKQKEETSNHE